MTRAIILTILLSCLLPTGCIVHVPATPHERPPVERKCEPQEQKQKAPFNLLDTDRMRWYRPGIQHDARPRESLTA